MTCSASYSADYIPINPGLCGQACRGCTFSAVVATSCTETGCHFSWTVSRTGCASQTDEDFSGHADLAPGGSKEVDFYCDPAESCARYRLTLTCTADSPATLPSDSIPGD